MEVATAIGADPAILISTVLKMPGETDKLAGAGGLMGEAVLLEEAKTVDVKVPANAEIIIEGYIDPKEKEKEGTLGEVSGYYLTTPSPTIHVTAISHRKDPLYHAFLPWSLEIDHLLTLVYGLNFIPMMNKQIPSLKGIHFVPGTFGSHIVMSIDKHDIGMIRSALTLALSFPYVKKAVIVDADIDPTNHLEVEWSMATRCQADRDYIIIPAMKGQPIDPSAGEGFVTAKVGIDATRPDRKGFEKVDFPGEVQDNAALFVKKLKEGN